jgi:hypothetical protein
MSRLSWGAVGERYYETGVDRGVLYVGEDPGVPWNGLISVTESPSGAEAKPYYIDGVRYLTRVTLDEFAATLTAFSSPREFDKVDGTEEVYVGLYAPNQRRKPFGLTYRTSVGNDVDGATHAYKIHLIYNALAVPGDYTKQTLGDSAQPTEFSWELSATPPASTAYRPTAHLVVDSREAPPDLMSRLEDILYGSELTAPRLLTVTELLDLFAEYAIFKVVILEDGVYTAEGSAVTDNGDGTFTMDHADVTDNLDGTFEIFVPD